MSMITPKTGSEWRKATKHAVAGVPAQEVLDAIDKVRGGASELATQTCESLLALAIMYCEDGCTKVANPLGEPTGRAFTRADGAHQRKYENGWLVFNPGINNNVLVEFEEPLTDAATQKTDTKHVVRSPGCGMFLHGGGDT